MNGRTIVCNGVGGRANFWNQYCSRRPADANRYLATTMIDEAEDYIKKISSAYVEGQRTGHDVANDILRYCASMNLSPEALERVFLVIPTSLYVDLKRELHVNAECNFYRRWTFFGDTRTAEIVHAETLRIQPLLRQISATMTRLLLLASRPS